MNQHLLSTLCFVFDFENDCLLVQQFGTGPYARLHSGIEGDCLPDENPASSCIKNLKQQAGIDTSGMRLRGIVKTWNPEKQEARLIQVYESNFVHGELQQNAPGRLKWVEILNIFNLKYTPVITETIPLILDSECFFESFFLLDSENQIKNKEIFTNCE